MKLLLPLILAISILSSGCAASRHIPEAEPFFDYSYIAESIRPLVYRDSVVCTATSINSKEGLWLTAAHCLKDMGMGMETIDDITITPVKVAKELDVAVIRAEGLDVPALRIGRSEPLLGDPVVVIGHPIGIRTLQLFKGHVASLATVIGRTPESQRYMLFDMTVCGGNSGSAIVNSRNEIISVVQIGYGRPCSTFSGGSTYEDLLEFEEFFEHKRLELEIEPEKVTTRRKFLGIPLPW